MAAFLTVSEIKKNNKKDNKKDTEKFLTVSDIKKNDAKPNNHLTYTQKISIIAKYFNVSDKAATYIYHRRKKSLQTDLPWTLELQNALVMADEFVGVDWDRMKFGEEEKELVDAGIIFSKLPKTKKIKSITPIDEILKTAENNEDGWTKVVSSYKQKKYKQNVERFIRAMKFL